MAITMKDIAEKANVSIYTVSRALNNKEDISLKTKNRIIDIANEMGYVPNSVARSLVTRKTHIIGLINSRRIDPFYSEKWEAINAVCFEKGYSILVCNSQDSADRELEYLHQLKSKRVDGILIDPTQHDDRYIDFLENCHIPYVYLNRHPMKMDCDYVKNDNVYGGYIAMMHLLDKNYRKIVYLCPKPNTTTGRERILGCNKAFLEKGLPPEDLIIESCDESIESCYRFVKERILKYIQPDAIFMWNDRLAVGAISAVMESGKRIPEDIALMGYDNLEYSKYLCVPLTSVAQSSSRIGELGTNILIEKIESNHKDIHLHQYVLKPELVIRNST